MRESLTLKRVARSAGWATLFFSVVTAIGIDHHLAELFTHFRLQYFAASSLLIFVFAYLRDRIAIGAMLIVTVLNTWLIAPWYLADRPAGGETPIKLIHVNVHSMNTSYKDVIDFIADEDPDIVFVQEVTPEWAIQLAYLPPEYQTSYVAARADNFGIAVYSKMPFETIRQEVSPPLGYPTIVLTTKIGDSRATFISTHPTIPLDPDLYAARNEHIASIAEVIARTDGKIVFSGDMNASLWDPKLKEFESRTGLLNVRAGSGVLPSWPTFLPIAGIPIDHALVSPGIGVVEVRTGRRVGSDHLPLVVTLTL